MKVNVFKNRGVVVSDPEAFGGLILELEECVDITILDCRAKVKGCVDITILDCRVKVKGLSGDKWAMMWLYKPSRRPYKILTAVPCLTSQKESAMTVKSLKRAFMASTSRSLLKGEGHLLQEGLR